MAEPRKISPILDGYSLGAVCCQRDAVQCCKAVNQENGEEAIVKVISIPASKTQMDALMLAGAFSGHTEATAYFKEEARFVLNQAKILRHMANIGGFLDYDCVQVVPSEDNHGFDVYLLSPLRQSLQHLLQKNDLRQMDVLNIGLDLCAALTACRQAGYIYANLKPGNIFCKNQHYMIGDLGFIPLSQLKSCTLPNQYKSSYTPPELMGAPCAVSDTADVYALGMILYQAYNGGVLPGNDAVFGRLLLPPKYADYEIAEIILRACAPDPTIRWRDPMQMGRALTRYMQRNGVRDTPVIPSVLKELMPKTTSAIEPFLPEEPIDPAELDCVETVEKQSVITRKKNTTRKKRATPPLLQKSKIAIAVLIAILILELIISLWILR